MTTGFVGDWNRQARTGIAEAVFCQSKSTAQIADILGEATNGQHRMLFTRLSAEKFADLPDSARDALNYEPVSQTAFLGAISPVSQPNAICIVSAGTSDDAVAREAQRTLEFMGQGASMVRDVGVAGLWRLMERAEFIGQHRIVIAVAGMEGALFSVIAGLVNALVIAVPTSVGYGVGQGGATALHSALASCSPGIVTVNIDNGFGAACAAMKALRL
ncbi:nickel pincer cofactor biosynthesis protein LarB [Aureimonas fodinaquatilis]|uniref:Nickel pincer cofactor biosynthesis protein LarB n=1 Tax=Aureimonas fodinaquatilis TaxID=2565783 RepID=A0A5B0DY72_9HYPH|nr:nickel pincer cofactor biosynthesis protein LarB [Aureimonas fodinaquatilis]KAA0970159.1 nickel pincer cofactor biosynthesis protein LarB [Aureimonas fodinaquatilis]